MNPLIISYNFVKEVPEVGIPLMMFGIIFGLWDQINYAFCVGEEC